MVVYDSESLEKALQLLKSAGTVRYSNRYMFLLVSDMQKLFTLCNAALKKGEVSIVVARGHEREMEDYEPSLRAIKKARKIEEQKRMRKWVREHPEEIERVIRRNAKSAKKEKEA